MEITTLAITESSLAPLQTTSVIYNHQHQVPSEDQTHYITINGLRDKLAKYCSMVKPPFQLNCNANLLLVGGV